MDRTNRKITRARACRNLFGDCPGSGISPSDEAFAEEKRKEFHARWGFDVNTDTADPNGPWEWEVIDYDDVPDVFKRIGGTRSRRFSSASIDSGEDAHHSRSGSFSLPNAEEDRRKMRTPEPPSGRDVRLSSDSSIDEQNASQRVLITGRLPAVTGETLQNSEGRVGRRSTPFTGDDGPLMMITCGTSGVQNTLREHSYRLIIFLSFCVVRVVDAVLVLFLWKLCMRARVCVCVRVCVNVLYIHSPACKESNYLLSSFGTAERSGCESLIDPSMPSGEASMLTGEEDAAASAGETLNLC
ncbi:hypothetical protein BIW11_06896 [Tropilaelaps mercedesae]|uniref:Uncharacterized protein n=1 Tax=Tropilaelaps mercedesae TaxID=418985 RepID=A0A1V9XW38_9ACAR|nr:hypothetical protein BIW11_06896 [Tropilaelaps mercedesae]